MNSLNNNIDSDLVKIEEYKNKKREKNEEKLETLEDYENFYLINGFFVYPDSLPFHEYPYGEERKPISKGEQEYLKKYEEAIINGKNEHLHLKKYKFSNT